MFNVERSQPAPDVRNNYLSKEVVFELEKIFYGKCYLCEDIVADPQIDKAKTRNTAQLLHRCYNENNTAIRCIFRKQLHERIFQRYSEFLVQSNKLYDISSSEREKGKAKEKLQNMTDISYPFSVFWKWHILTDNF